MPKFLDEDLDKVEKEQGGKGLRRLLEEAIADNRTLRAEMAGQRAEKVIETEGLTLVKPEDLSDVEPDKMAEVARELEKSREAEQAEVIRQALARKGLDGEDLEAAVASLVGENPGAVETRGVDSIRQLAGVASAAAATGTVDPSKLHGPAAILYAFEQAETRRNK